MHNQKNKIVKVKGGLGNQLFQVAFAIFLKKLSACEIFLDISWFETQSLRKFQFTDYLCNLDFKIKSIKPSFFNKVISYRSELFKTYFFKKGMNLPISFYDGYWQQIFFASHLRDSQFLNKDILLKKTKEEYYVVHLRRDDFLSSGPHHVLSDEYYMKYINIFNDKKIYILSSNKSDALSFKDKINIKTEYIECSDIEAFNIIHNASGGLASNSTFCWWAIYLSNNRNWIFPYQWMRKKNIFDYELNIEGTIIA
jgi:hypothetical protein